MLSLHNISFQYPNREPIAYPNFKTDNTEPLLIIGLSGCGKSTLLQLIAGFSKPNKGSISLLNTNLNELKPRKIQAFRQQQLGIIHQENLFINSLSIQENILLQCKSVTKETKLRLNEIAKRLQIVDQLQQKPQELSHGQLQRAQIVRALIHQPKVILADEPTSSLDDTNTKSFLALIKSEVIDKGIFFILVTHDQRVRNNFNQVLEL